MYVGKAKNIKNRLKSYYNKDHGRGPRIDLMLDEANDIKIIETDSEIEAILLEAELINKLKPKYNVSLKDDKSFLAISFSNHDYPKLEMIRWRDKKIPEGNKKNFYGPYPSGDLLKKSIRYLRKLFPFRDCSDSKYQLYQKRNRTCLYGDLNLCLGPCTKQISKEDYKKELNYLKEFLRGKKAGIVLSLKKRMEHASKKQSYEHAAVLRNKIYALEHLHQVALGIRDDNFASSKIIFNRIECFDISNIMGEYAVGSMSVITSGEKDKDQYRKFKIKWIKGSNDVAMMKEVLKRRFRNDWPVPDLIVIDGGIPQMKVALEVLKTAHKDIPVVSVAKGPKRDKNELHFSNTDIGKYIKSTPEAIRLIIIARDEAHRFAVSYYRLLHKKGMLENKETNINNQTEVRRKAE